MSRPKTDKQRVLEQLQTGRVITLGDFGFPRACDGGKPITRLAARIHDLKADGHPVESMTTTLGSAKVAGYYLKTSSGAVPHARVCDGPAPDGPSESSRVAPANAGAPVRVRTGPPAAPAPTPPTAGTSPARHSPTPAAAPQGRTGHDADAAPQLDLFHLPGTDPASPYQEAA